MIIQYPALGNRHIPVACGQAFLGTTQVAHDQSQSVGTHSNCCISLVWMDQTEGNGNVWRIFVCFIGLKLPVGPCVGITLHTWHSDLSGGKAIGAVSPLFYRKKVELSTRGLFHCRCCKTKLLTEFGFNEILCQRSAHGGYSEDKRCIPSTVEVQKPVRRVCFANGWGRALSNFALCNSLCV